MDFFKRSLGINELAKSKSPSLREAKRRSNLLLFQRDIDCFVTLAMTNTKLFRLFTRTTNLVQTTLFVNKWRHSRTFLTVLFLAVLLSPLPVQAKARSAAAKPTSGLTTLVSNGGYALTREDRLLAAHNLDQPLIPASTAKLITALAALDLLGPDYRFRTEIYQDSADNLYLKGYGDPFLVSEEVAAIIEKLRSNGVNRINAIYIDDSAYALEEPLDGLDGSGNPYDVGPAALAVNFNSVNLRLTGKGRVESTEEQTPLLPLMVELGRKLPAGHHQFNVTANPSHPIQLAGQLFRAFQQQADITGNGEIDRRPIPPEARLILVHQSRRNLTELIQNLLEFSNNFIANQIFLALGTEKFGYPATWDKGRRAMTEYLARDPLLAKEIHLEEGSGLSRRNRVTVRAMMRVLELFSGHAGLLPEKQQCLLKSGTMKGIYAYAGFLPCPNGRDRVVIILNQAKNRRDEVLRILWRVYDEAGEGGLE